MKIYWKGFANLNNHKQKLIKIEEMLKELNPIPEIAFIEKKNIFYSFGEVNEKENYKKCLEYVFEDKIPEQKFNSFIDLQNHYKTIFGNKNFVLKDLNNIKLEIENIFSIMT